MKVNRNKKACWLAFGVMTLASALLSGAANAQRGDVRAGDSVRLTGRIRDLDRNDTTFVLDSNVDDRRITVRAAGATITNRDIRPDTRYRVRDLRLGEVVEVYGTWLDRSTIRADRVARTGLAARGYDDRDDDPYYDRDDRLPDRDGWGRDARSRDGLTGTLTDETGNVSRTMKVRANGRTYDVEVPREVRVYRNGRTVSVHELKEGDRVRVRGDWRGDRLRADRVDAVDRDRYRDDYDDGPGRDNRSFTGTVERIDTRGRTLRLRTATRTYEVDAREADVVSVGRNRRFADLREGDRITVTGDVRGSRLFAERIREGGRYDRGGSYTRSDRETVTGTVEDMDTLNRTFRILGLERVTVRVTADSDLRDEDGDRVAFRDLREGDRVRVSGDRNGSFLMADRVDRVSR